MGAFFAIAGGMWTGSVLVATLMAMGAGILVASKTN